MNRFPHEDYAIRQAMINRTGDPIVCNKGYFLYQNYVDGILGFRIVPLTFSKKKFCLKNLLNRLSYPLFVFGRSDTWDRVRYPYLNFRDYKYVQKMPLFPYSIPVITK